MSTPLNLANVHPAEQALNKMVDDQAKQLLSYRGQLNDAHQALQEREAELQQQRDAWTEEYGISDEQLALETGPLKLNVGGEEVLATRRLLSFRQDTFLGVMFSGRWEKRLQRDPKGRIFLDVDREAFQGILDYLLDLKGGNNDATLPKVREEKKVLYQHMLLLFGFMQQEEGEHKESKNESDVAPPPTKKRKKQSDSWKTTEFLHVTPEVKLALESLRKELCRSETALEVQERFQKTEMEFVDKFAAGEDKDVLLLNVMGTHVCTKRTTIRMTPFRIDEQGQKSPVETMLSRKHDDTVWTCDASSGIEGEYVENNPECFKIIVNQLRMRAWMQMNKKVDQLSFQSPVVPKHLQSKYDSMVKFYFPDCEDFVGTAFRMSEILTVEEEAQIMAWKEGGQLTEVLWRGSRDGFKAIDFHSRCDGHGNTVMVVKDTKGNVFGGYVAAAWTNNDDEYIQCSKAFVFSLRRVHYPQGGMVRGKVNGKDESGEAIFSDKSQGPTFGGGHDICIASDCNENSESYVYEASYELPADFGSYYMVCGDGSDSHFRVSEIEVMQCSN